MRMGNMFEERGEGGGGVVGGGGVFTKFSVGRFGM